jgi:LCP family protein required for cell wall assembly
VKGDDQEDRDGAQTLDIGPESGAPTSVYRDLGAGGLGAHIDDAHSIATESTGGLKAAQPRSATIAAGLSFLWPGLGQWYVDHRREALLFAIPVAIGLLVLLLWLAQGLEQALVALLLPGVALAFVVAILADGVWRITAGVRSAWLAGGRAALRRPSTGGLIVVLTLVVVVTHVWASAVAWSLFEASGRIFVPPIALGPTPAPGASPSDQFFASPGVTPATPDSRINVLLTGIDSSEIRTHALTDTLIVVSVDPVTHDVAMISFPRDIARFKEPDGTTFKGKINSLMTYAGNHPGEYPAGGLPTLIDELGYLLGVPIHYYAAVDLAGFARLIDTVGGITVNNPKAINDPGYGGWTDGHVGFKLSAGEHHLDGETALAYVRSRKGAGDNDFTRARRQQQVLLALRSRVTDPALLPQLPSIITAASQTIRTNFPADRIDEMLSIGSAIQSDDSVKRVVLGPPYARNPPKGTPGGYQLILDMDRLAKLSVKLFGDDSAYAHPAGG